MRKEQLQIELNQALKAGNTLKRSVLGLLLTAIKNRELSKRNQLSKTVVIPAELEQQSQLSEEEILAVISTEAKKRKEALAMFQTAGRTELAAKEAAELKILENYLPAQLDETAIRASVRAAIKQLGATGSADLGKVVGLVVGQLRGQADGGLISQIAKNELTS